MRIVNIIEINRGIIQQVLSYPIYEDQLSQDVVGDVEEDFKKMILKQDNQIDESDLEGFVENGHYDNQNGYELSIVWSS